MRILDTWFQQDISNQNGLCLVSSNSLSTLGCCQSVQSLFKFWVMLDLTSLTSERTFYSLNWQTLLKFDSFKKRLNYANSRSSSSWQLFRKFAFIRTAQVILCIKTVSFKWQELSLVELEINPCLYKLCAMYCKIKNLKKLL